ncbi:hypothetical protein ACFFRR_000294 [Megaselia abdita]
MGLLVNVDNTKNMKSSRDNKQFKNIQMTSSQFRISRTLEDPLGTVRASQSPKVQICSAQHQAEDLQDSHHTGPDIWMRIVDIIRSREKSVGSTMSFVTNREIER